MNIVLILFTSLIVFIGIRLVFVFLYWILQKMFRLSGDNLKFDFGMSVGFYGVYIQSFLGAVLGVAKNNELNNTEWYFVYTFIGIVSMLWCYFSWDMRLRALPKFGLNDKQVVIKKITVFALVMFFSFINGYADMCEEFNMHEMFPEIKVLNSTMIVGVIAFDRFLNQIANYKKLKQEEKKGNCN